MCNSAQKLTVSVLNTKSIELSLCILYKRFNPSTISFEEAKLLFLKWSW